MKDQTNSAERILIKECKKGNILIFTEQQKLHMYILFYFLSNCETGIIILILETLKHRNINKHLEFKFSSI